MSQTSITLTFTASAYDRRQQLDNIEVENLTQGGNIMLYYPDTLLELDHGTAVFDQQALPAGEHTFILHSGSERYSLLVVETSSNRRVQKLVNFGGGSTFKIEYSGALPDFSGYRHSKSGFPYAPGDKLHFTGYATLMWNIPAIDTITDDPVTSSLYLYTFQFTDTYLLGYVHCDPGNPTAIAGVINPKTGRTWMDRNLGASQAATSSTDVLSYGDLYIKRRRVFGYSVRCIMIN